MCALSRYLSPVVDVCVVSLSQPSSCVRCLAISAQQLMCALSRYLSPVVDVCIVSLSKPSS